MATFLYGAYGTGNLGDDLLLKAALQEHSNECVTAVAYAAPRLRGQPHWVEHNSFLASPSSHLSPGDRLIFAGGGLFWAASHTNDMLRVAQEADQLGCTVSIERIGAQGFQTDPDAVRQLMGICSSVTVRDKNSALILKKYHVTDRAEVSKDFVFCLKECISLQHKLASAAPQHKLRVGINHSATPFFYDLAHRDKVLDIYTSLARTFRDSIDFIYVPHTRHFNVIAENDIIVGEWFWQRSRGLITAILWPSTAEDLLDVYATLDSCIGWRYHLLVLGTVFELPTTYLGAIGGHKYYSFAQEEQLNVIDFDQSTSQVIEQAEKRFQRLLDK